MTIADWAEPQNPAAPGSRCPEPDCAACRVLEAGARELCRQVDQDYDALDDHAREHFTEIVLAVQTVMLDAAETLPDPQTGESP